MTNYQRPLCFILFVCLVVSVDWCEIAQKHSQQRSYGEAVDAYRKCIEGSPRSLKSYAIHQNIGMALMELKRISEATESFKTVLLLKPDFFQAYWALGILFMDSGQLTDSLWAYSHATRLQPAIPDLYVKQAQIFRKIDQIEEALRAYTYAILCKPADERLWFSFGQFLIDVNDWSYLSSTRHIFGVLHTVLRLLPSHPPQSLARSPKGPLPLSASAHFSLAMQYSAAMVATDASTQNTLPQVVHHCTQALQWAPDFLPAAVLRLSTQKQMCFWQSHSSEFSPSWLVDRLSEVFPPLETQPPVRWPSRAACDRPSPLKAIAPVRPHEALSLGLPANVWLSLSATYAAAALSSIPQRACPVKRARVASPPSSALVVAYVSADFTNHATAHLIKGALALHSRPVRALCFSWGAGSDGEGPWRKEIAAVCPLQELPSSLEEAAAMLATAGVHVLVNLNGWTAGVDNRLFALAPAPVAALYLGYPGSMATPHIPYLISDSVVAPPDLRHLFTEAMVYLPRSFYVNDHRRYHSEMADGWPGYRELHRARLGVSNATVVYCNFNQLYKLDPVTFALWMDVMRGHDSSLLWLIRFTSQAEVNLRNHAAALGVEPSRLRFSSPVDIVTFVQQATACDLFLDTAGVTAHTVAMDSLWAGVPLLTTAGEHYASRVAASILLALDMPELVARTPSDLLAIALTTSGGTRREPSLTLGDGHAAPTTSDVEDGVARGLPFLDHTKSSLSLLPALARKVRRRCRTSSVFDTAWKVRELQTTYSLMWEVHAAGCPPMHIVVVSGNAARPYGLFRDA